MIDVAKIEELRGLLDDFTCAVGMPESEKRWKVLAVANITKIDAATGKNLCELPLDSDEVLEAWDALNAALRRARSELEAGHE